MEIHKVHFRIRVTLSRIEICVLVFAEEGKSDTQRKHLGAKGSRKKEKPQLHMTPG